MHYSLVHYNEIVRTLLLENGLITSWFSGPLERHLSSLFSDKDTELYLWDSELVTEDFHAAEKF